MNREEVLKQLQSIFRDILKKHNVCIANPHANYSSNRETFRSTFQFQGGH